jgi:hypothetical protein
MDWREKPQRSQKQSGGGLSFASRDPATLVNAVHSLEYVSGSTRIMRQNLKSFYWSNFDPYRLVSRYRAQLGEKEVPTDRALDGGGAETPAS